MAEDGGKPDHGAAQRMLDLCASVGASSFDVTWTTAGSEPRRYDEGVSLADLTRRLPVELDRATARRQNLIIRPRGPDVTFLQLDDLGSGKLAHVAELAFVTLQTSPGKDGSGNFQAWLALSGDHSRAFCSRVRKGAGADIGASGATRIPGSFNFKPDHAPEKTGRRFYPRVAIIHARPQLTTSPAELERFGLVAAEEQFAPIAPARFESQHLRQWPNWQMSVDGAPLRKDGNGPDLSIADFRWCMLSRTWGFDERDIIDELLTRSEHARRPENGRPYAERSAKKAVAWVEQRREQKRHRHG